MNRIAFKLGDSYGKDKIGYLASSRIRGHWLAKYWKEADDFFYPEYFNQTSEEFFNPENQLKLFKDYQVVIFNKTYEWKLAKLLKNNGKKVIVDFCDPDHLLSHSSKERVKNCLQTLEFADAVVVNGEKLKESISKIYNGNIYIIPDRVDFTFHKPQKQTHREKIRSIVWYGYSENLRILEPYIADIIDMGIEITIITDKPDDGFIISSQNDPRKFVTFKHWHPETVNQQIIEHDLVFIAKDQDEYFRQFKSYNRYLTATALKMPFAEDIEHLKCLKSKKSREEQVKELYKIVKKYHNVKISVKEYKKIIKELL